MNAKRELAGMKPKSITERLNLIANVGEDVEEGFPEEEFLPDVVEQIHRPRPENWKVIAEFYSKYGLELTRTAFETELAGRSYAAVKAALWTWRKQIKSPVVIKKENSGRMPAYGAEIDNLLRDKVVQRIDLGLPADNPTLRILLEQILTDHDKLHLLKSKGGPCIFEDSWAQRFWARHNLVSRVVTTKMRIVPENFEDLQENFIKIGALIICEHNIPSELVYGTDETNVLLCQRSNKTRARKGSKRVRALAVGSEKAQITAMLACVEATGEVLPPQLIFEGKTKKCLPLKGAQKPPDGWLYSFTESHW